MRLPATVCGVDAVLGPALKAHLFQHAARRRIIEEHAAGHRLDLHEAEGEGQHVEGCFGRHTPTPGRGGKPVTQLPARLIVDIEKPKCDHAKIGTGRPIGDHPADLFPDLDMSLHALEIVRSAVVRIGVRHAREPLRHLPLRHLGLHETEVLLSHWLEQQVGRAKRHLVAGFGEPAAAAVHGHER